MGDLGPKFWNIVLCRFSFSPRRIPAIYRAAFKAAKFGEGRRAIRENVDERCLSGAAVKKLTDTGFFLRKGISSGWKF